MEASIGGRQPRLLMLVGPPGVGRTRLLAELAAALVDRAGLYVLEAQCSPLGRETSYGLTASLVRMRFAIHPESTLPKLPVGTQNVSGVAS